MAKSVKITRYSSVPVDIGYGEQGWRVRIEVDHAIDMPEEIFLFRKTTINPTTGELGDAFSTVCAYSDLSLYPVDEPDEGVLPPFFRKSSVDVILPATADIDDYYDSVKERVQALVDAANALDTLTEDDTVSIS